MKGLHIKNVLSWKTILERERILGREFHLESSLYDLDPVNNVNGLSSKMLGIISYILQGMLCD